MLLYDYVRRVQLMHNEKRLLLHSTPDSIFEYCSIMRSFVAGLLQVVLESSKNAMVILILLCLPSAMYCSNLCNTY